MHKNQKQPGASMGDLLPDVLLYIADILHQEQDPGQRKIPLVMTLSLINRHWRKYMKLHPLFTAAQFGISSRVSCQWFNDYHREPFTLSKLSSFHDIETWLAHPDRINKTIYSFKIILDSDKAFYDFCHLLDNQFTDTLFDSIKIVADYDEHYDSSTVRRLRLPESLRARHLNIYGKRGNGFLMTFDWDSINPYLINNLLSIELNFEYIRGIPEKLQFKSLRDFSSLMATDDAVYCVESFLSRHTAIQSLKLETSPYLDLPPLSIDALDGLKQLQLDNAQLRLDTDKVYPLEELSYRYIERQIPDWSFIADTLTVLSFKWILGSLNEIFGASHDFIRRDMLYKLENLTSFTFIDCDSPRFVERFNSGMYDDAMPRLETLFMNARHIEVAHVHRFVAKHKLLKQVNVVCKGQRLVLNEAGGKLVQARLF